MMWTLRWLLLWVTLALAMDDYRMGDSLHKIVLGANIRNHFLPTALGVNFGFKYMYVVLILFPVPGTLVLKQAISN
jgi:hypothetical protein